MLDVQRLNPWHERVLGNLKFQQLVRERSGFAWTLSAVMLLVYCGFILLVAFAKNTMATRIGTGVTSVGIVIGLAVIVTAFLLTGLYVARANTQFDKLTEGLKRDFDEGSNR
ncbi:DUF485 domain-containing protein [Roseomonas nepalensis]|uniref:DUF485 domain-containing protein n=1 Tax=Muricoccus nepalensis TaxID=1854500 RepID=A0A502FUX8_9PROT|nr:DUF485 domain-containing protein [Roseomonas nepalensis]TPG53427.1 DUF485 domain-containing protein [Roseomonas nepalensis]